MTVESSVPVGNTGDALRTFAQNPTGSEIVQTEAVALADTTDTTQVARVKSEAPASDDAGLVVRVAGEAQIDIERDIFARAKVSIDANQVEIPYDDTNWATFVDQTSSGGAPAASQANGQVTVSSGTGTNGTRHVLSKDTNKYRLGQEIGWGGTFAFGNSAGVAGATVWWGPTDNTSFTNAVRFMWDGVTWGVQYRRGGSTIWFKTTADWIAGWETKYGATMDKTKDQIARIRAGLFGHRGFVVELASPIPNDDGSVRWVKIIDHTNVNSEAVAVFTNNDLKIGMGVEKVGAGATNLSITSACQAGWTASDKARISDTLSDRTLASRVVAALVGRTNAGDWVGVNVNNQGRLFVTNDSVGATGAAAPASATYTGVLSGGNLVGMTQPLTDTQLRATAVPVSEAEGAVTPKHVTATTSGESTIIAPAAGNAIRLWWYHLNADSGNSAKVVAGLRFGTGGTDFFSTDLSQYGGSVAHSFKAGKSYYQGAVDAPLLVNLSAAQTVRINIDYEEFTP